MLMKKPLKVRNPPKQAQRFLNQVPTLGSQGEQWAHGGETMAACGPRGFAGAVQAGVVVGGRLLSRQKLENCSEARL